MANSFSIGASNLYLPPTPVTGSRNLNPGQALKEFSQPVLDVVEHFGKEAKEELSRLTSPGAFRALEPEASALKTMEKLGKNAGFLAVAIDLGEGVVDICDILKDNTLSRDEKSHRVGHRALETAVDMVWDGTVGGHLVEVGVGVGGIVGGLAAAEFSEKTKELMHKQLADPSPEVDPIYTPWYNPSPLGEQRYGTCSAFI